MMPNHLHKSEYFKRCDLSLNGCYNKFRQTDDNVAMSTQQLHSDTCLNELFDNIIPKLPYWSHRGVICAGSQAKDCLPCLLFPVLTKAYCF